MSFAFAAVLLFLGASLAAATFAYVEHEAALRRLVLQDERMLRSGAEEVERVIETRARYSAAYALYLTRDTGEDPNAVFVEDMASFLEENSPFQVGRVFVSVSNASFELLPRTAVHRDLVPTTATGSESIEGGRVYYVSSHKMDELGRSSACLGAEVSYSLVLNATDTPPGGLDDGGGGGAGAGYSVLPVDRRETLDTVFPFLETRMDRLASNTESNETGVSRLVSYMLTTLLQYRILMGEGAVGGPRDAGDMLTPWDVEVAVNLAVMLEELRAFRAVDPRSVEAFDMNNGQKRMDNASILVRDGRIRRIAERSISSLLLRYTREGTLDPADLLALFLCMDARPVNMRAVVSQVLYTVMDQLVLKYLDYFGIPGDGVWDKAHTSSLSYKALDHLDVDQYVTVDADPFPGSEIMGYANATLTEGGSGTAYIGLNGTGYVNWTAGSHPTFSPLFDSVGSGERVFFAWQGGTVKVDASVSLPDFIYDTPVGVEVWIRSPGDAEGESGEGVWERVLEANTTRMWEWLPEAVNDTGGNET
ncbi:MAG: hypothetical protein J7L61_01555, partial [Thermoplasmata archaeon]|nr:hypothetical protein [Thermoplasmata archaeon]